MRLLYVVALAVSCSLCPVWTQSSSSCSGAFDFIFVVDSSLSLADHYKDSVVPFVEDVATHFVNPDFRLSIITFDEYVHLHLPLTPTQDREAIKEGIESMRNVAHGIGTDLPAAIDEALTQISNKSDSVKVVLVVTDGLWTGNIFRGVVELKKLGVLRFIVAIGNVDEEEFLQFVDSLDQTFIGNDFLYLQQIIDMVIERTCVEVTSIQPSQYCQDRNATDLQLKGRGFTINLNRNRAQCRFQTDNGPIVTRPVGEITKYNMTCEDPGINKTGKYVIQITLDGVTYVTSSVRLVVADCKVPGDDRDGGGGGGGGGKVDAGLAVGLLFAIIGLILLILLCCFWIFFPLICCRIVGGLPTRTKRGGARASGAQAWQEVGGGRCLVLRQRWGWGHQTCYCAVGSRWSNRGRKQTHKSQGC
jgi:hypothetical protein